MQFIREKKTRQVSILVALLTMAVSCGDRELIHMQVELSRSVSKLPFVIALDQGLYEKYGLDIEVKLEPPEFEGGVRMPSTNLIARIWRKARQLTSEEALWDPDIHVAGAVNRIAGLATTLRQPHMIAVAATDCMVRTRIVAKQGIERLEDLKGLRIGVSSQRSNSGYVALLLADRMGWDPVHDISVLEGGNTLDALRDGRVDAFVASERDYAVALQEGFPMIEDMANWQEPLAGNSVNVPADWLGHGENREAMRRFLQATSEGIALLHQDRELVLAILDHWHGISDRKIAEAVYDAGKWIPRKPYPCLKGIEKTMVRFDSNEMRKYTAKDFYDDSLIRELDESGFLDGLYSAKE
jgi:NitT/TauT family transport system substrate-binding protein